MPGETEEKPSGWTTDTLHAHIMRLVAELDRRYEQRFDAQEKAVNAALQAAQQAVSKAETAAEKRFDSVNEFRAALGDQTATLMPRAESTLRWEGLAERVATLERLGVAERGRSKGLADSWGFLAGAVGVAVGVIAILVAIN